MVSARFNQHPGQRTRWAKHQSLVQAPAADAVGEVAPTTINLDDNNDEMVDGDANAEAV